MYTALSYKMVIKLLILILLNSIQKLFRKWYVGNQPVLDVVKSDGEPSSCTILVLLLNRNEKLHASTAGMDCLCCMISFISKFT